MNPRLFNTPTTIGDEVAFFNELSEHAQRGTAEDFLQIHELLSAMGVTDRLKSLSRRLTLSSAAIRRFRKLLDEKLGR
jgi:hypothetical protein